MTIPEYDYACSPDDQEKPVAKASDETPICCGICGGWMTPDEQLACPWSSRFAFVHAECWHRRPLR